MADGDIPLPRVYIHDASLVRIGEVTTAAAVERSFIMGGEGGVAAFDVLPSDPLIANLDHRKGRLVVVESDAYPHPWVGLLTQSSQGVARGAISFQARSFDRILAQRFLGADANFRRSCPEAMAEVLERVNAANPTGIGLGRLAGSQAIYEGSLPFESARSALDKIAQFGGLEWWLSYELADAEPTITLNVSEAQGEDRYADTTIADGGNARWLDWIMDSEQQTFGLSVVGGQVAAGQAVNRRPRSSADIDSAELQVYAPHGSEVEGLEPRTGVMGRVERQVIAGHLRAQGLTQAASRALLGRQRVGGSVRSLRLEMNGTDTSTWAALRPGSKVRCSAPSAFLGEGVNGPVRIKGVQPREFLGTLELTVEILKAPD